MDGPMWLGTWDPCEVVSPNFHALNGWDRTDWPQVTWDLGHGTRVNRPFFPPSGRRTKLHTKKSCTFVDRLLSKLRLIAVMQSGPSPSDLHFWALCGHKQIWLRIWFINGGCTQAFASQVHSHTLARVVRGHYQKESLMSGMKISWGEVKVKVCGVLFGTFFPCSPVKLDLHSRIGVVLSKATMKHLRNLDLLLFRYACRKCMFVGFLIGYIGSSNYVFCWVWSNS